MDTLLLAARVIVSLVAVFGLMWLLHRKLRAGGPATRARALTVVARQSVGQKASVVLVDTGGRRLLLGVTEHGIAVLHSDEAPEPLPGDASGSSEPMRAPVADRLAVVDPTADRLMGDEDATLAVPTAPVPPLVQLGPVTGHEVRGASFEEELARERADLGSGAVGPAPRGGGSVLDPATWRLAADAIRSSRRS